MHGAPNHWRTLKSPSSVPVLVPYRKKYLRHCWAFSASPSDSAPRALCPLRHAPGRSCCFRPLTDKRIFILGLDLNLICFCNVSVIKYHLTPKARSRSFCYSSRRWDHDQMYIPVIGQVCYSATFFNWKPPKSSTKSWTSVCALSILFTDFNTSRLSDCWHSPDCNCVSYEDYDLSKSAVCSS